MNKRTKQGKIKIKIEESVIVSRLFVIVPEKKKKKTAGARKEEDSSSVSGHMHKPRQG